MLTDNKKIDITHSTSLCGPGGQLIVFALNQLSGPAGGWAEPGGGPPGHVAGELGDVPARLRAWLQRAPRLRPLPPVHVHGAGRGQDAGQGQDRQDEGRRLPKLRGHQQRWPKFQIM